MVSFFILLWASGVLSASIGSQYRSDVLLDKELYPENFPTPSGGGRIHYTLPSSVSYSEAKTPFTVEITILGEIFSINLGINQSLPTRLNWIHCDLSSSGMLWLSMHTSHDEYAKYITHVKVKDASSKVLADTSLPSLTLDYKVRTTYVTSLHNFETLVVHLHNYDSYTKILEDIIVDGKSTGKKVSLSPDEHAVFTFSVQKSEGDIWTVEYKTNDGQFVGNGGRLGKEIFPIEVWNYDSDCPFPESNKTNFDTLKSDFLVDVLYLREASTCGKDPMTILSDAPSYDYHVLFDHVLETSNNVPSDLVNYSDSIAAICLGNEIDTNIYYTVAAWQTSMRFRNLTPKILGYQGGGTYSNAGTFSGIADIQGKVFDVAGCAPHVTTSASAMRIQGTYDYIKNTRDNHMPLTVWAYSQFISNVWPVQPNANEISVQLASAVAGGSKALMLFQVDLSYAGTSWLSTVMYAMKPIKLIAQELRVADIEGAKFSKDDGDKSTVSVLRAPDKLIVIVINNNCSGYSDILCYSRVNDHWDFSKYTLGSLTITLPDDMTTAKKVMEVTKDGIVQPTAINTSFSGGNVDLKNIALGTDTTVVRYFLIY